MTSFNKHDVFRQTPDYGDLLRIVAAYYELYTKAYSFSGPWIAKQTATNFMAPDKNEIVSALGKPRNVISPIIYSKFIDSLFQFIITSKGKKALAYPDPTTIHSAQFAVGTFSIRKVEDPKVLAGLRKNPKYRNLPMYELNVFGCEQPLYIAGMVGRAQDIKHVIVRPKLGKLGTPSVSNWEVLLSTTNLHYKIDHTDSQLNPKWAGKL